MKRLLALFLMIILVFTLVACGNNDADKSNDSTPAGNDTTVSADENNNAANGSLTVDTVKNAKETDASLFEYEEVEGGVSITGFNGDDEIVVIPSTIDGKNVVEIERNAFVNNKTMLGLKLADSIKNIGANAFENCVALKVFISGSSLTNISEFAFNGCKELCDVELNEGLSSLGMLSFGRTNMSELYIPGSVKTIEMPFTANMEKTLKIISTAGSEAEKYVSADGESFNLVFEAK